MVRYNTKIFNHMSFAWGLDSGDSRGAQSDLGMEEPQEARVCWSVHSNVG